jgi:hypothetical protein
MRSWRIWQQDNRFREEAAGLDRVAGPKSPLKQGLLGLVSRENIPIIKIAAVLMLVEVSLLAQRVA